MEAEPLENLRRVYTNILNELQWKSDLWTLYLVQVLYLTEEVRQADDLAFVSLFRSIARSTISKNAPVHLRSIGGMQTAYQYLWKWITTRRKEDMDLSTMIIASKNQLVDKPSAGALYQFPGERFNLLSAKTVQSDRVQNPESEILSSIVPKFAYMYEPTGVPHYNLDLKIGVPVMNIRNVMHPAVVNGKLVMVVRVDQCTMQVAQCDENGQALER